MAFADMYPSRYLKKEDVLQPVQTTIRGIAQQEVKSDKGGNDFKNVLYFNGLKEMILNVGNGSVLFEAYGEPDPPGAPIAGANWAGKPVEVYADPSVMMGGKRVGGIRLRIPRFGQQGFQVPPSPLATPVAPPAAIPGAWTFAQACEEAFKVGITATQLVQGLKNDGRTGWNGVRDTPHVQAAIAQAMKYQEAFPPQAAPPPQQNLNDEIPF